MERTNDISDNTQTVGNSETEENAGSTNTRQTKQATGKQLVAIIFILALATKMFLLPIYLIQSTGRDGYIALAIYGAFDLILLVPIFIAIRIAETDIFDVLTSVLGKIGAKIAVGIMCLFFFFKLNTAIAEILAFYDTNVFTDFDTSLMVKVLLVFLAAAGTHTLRSLCRLNELLMPVIVICLFVLVGIVIITSFDLANILPAVQNTKNFGNGVLRHAAWAGDFTPLVLFVGRTKTKKHTWCFAAGAGAIGTATAVFFALVLSAAFGNVGTLADATTNLSNILQFTVGNVYGRIDMFSSIVWSISVFIEAALFFYAACRCIAFVVGKNAHFIISVAVSVAVYIVQVFALTDPTIFYMTVTSVPCSITAAVVSAAIPVVVVTCAALNKKRGGCARQ